MLGMVRIALFGASGLLGWSIFQELKRRGLESYQFSQKAASDDTLVSFKSLNLISDELVTRELFDLWPDAIINCAAISSPDTVKKNPIFAQKINVDAAQRLAQISSHLGARFIHISSDMVFEGREQPYRSTDSPNPLSEYGRQKLESEKKVLSSMEDNVVVLRLTLINGNSPRGNRSPHERIFESIRSKSPLTLFDDEYRQPCSADNVASVVVELLERPNLNGLFHWAGSEVITRYELGRRILDRFGFSHELILRGSLKDYQKRLGKRPANLTFELSPLIGKIKTKPETISEQLQSLKVPNSLFRWYRENADDPSKYILRI